jgi:gliding motility-associated-like protein
MKSNALRPFYYLIALSLFCLSVTGAQAQNLTISTSGNTGAFGTGWSLTGTTLTVTGTANVHPDVITAALAAGDLKIENTTLNGDININNNIITPVLNAVRTITFNANGSIHLATNATIDATQNSNTNPLNIVFWSDFDGDVNGGNVVVNANSSIKTNGGGIWLGGGAGSVTWVPFAGASPITTGDSYASAGISTTHSSGVELYSNTIIQTGGGNFYAKGMSSKSANSADGVFGIYIDGANINSGTGNIELYGNATGSTTTTVANTFGLIIQSNAVLSSAAGNITIEGTLERSANFNYGAATWIGHKNNVATASSSGNVTITSTTGNISIKGTGNDYAGGGTDYRHGLAIVNSYSGEHILISSISGNVTLNGSASFATNSSDCSGLQLHTAVSGSTVKVISQSGTISLKGSNTQEGVTGANAISFAGLDANSISIGDDGTQTSTGNILIEANSIKQQVTVGQAAGSLAAQTKGTFAIQPKDASFTQLRLGDSGNLTLDNFWNFGTTLSGFTFGKAGNTQDITFSNPITLAGSFTAYAGKITIDSTINTQSGGVNGEVNLQASKSIAVVSANIITTAGNITLNVPNTLQPITTSNTGVAPSSTDTTTNTAILLSAAILDASGGNILLNAKNANVHAGANSKHQLGIYISFTGATIKTSRAGAIILNGDVADASSSAGSYMFGVCIWSDAPVLIQTDSGSIQIIGKHASVTAPEANYSVVLYSNPGADSTKIQSLSGPISFIGQKPSNPSPTGNGVFIGAKNSIGKGSLAASNSNIKIVSDNYNLSSASFNSTGVFTFEPFSKSFATTFIWPVAGTTFSNFSGLTIGKADDTSTLIIAGAVSLNYSGPVNLSGKNISINQSISSGASNFIINASGNVTQQYPITAGKLGLLGTGNFGLKNPMNNVGTIAAGDATSAVNKVFFTNNGSLTIGQVNPAGITATDSVYIETVTGNINLSENIATASTSAEAIILNAGRSKSVGDSTGGNIIVTGTPIITTGSGGRASLYSGSDMASNGLRTLVGNSSNVRYEVDETVSSITPALGAGKYALYRVSSLNVNLDSLIVSAGSLSPVFASATINYKNTVANAVSTITITPKLSDVTATVKVNGTTVSNGTASTAIPLNVGDNTITTVVTAQDGATKTYTVVVTRTAATVNDDANLSALVLSSGTLNPVFTPSTINYTAWVPTTVASITLTPTLSDPNATLKVNGVAVTSGTVSSPITLKLGKNTIVVEVKAVDGATIKSYTVTVIKGLYVADIIVPKNNLYAVFDVIGNPGQLISLSLRDITAKGLSVDYGNTSVNNLETSVDGVTWVPYTIIPALTPSGTLKVRTPITIKSNPLIDGTFKLIAKPIATDFTNTPIYNVNYNLINLNNLQLESGSIGEVDAIYYNPSVITINGQVVDARLKILAKQNVLYFLVDNNGGNPERLQSEISASPSGSYVDYSLKFYASGTNTEVGLVNFFVTGVDVDGLGSDDREFIQLNNMASYELGANTQLTVTNPASRPGFTQFFGLPYNLNGITFENTAAFVANYSDPVKEVQLRQGYSGTYPYNNVGRLFSLAFGAPIGSFTSSQTIDFTTSAVGIATINAIINEPPVISNILTKEFCINRATDTVGFTVSDAESPFSSLIVKATSSNAALISNAGLILSGTAANRVLSFTPVSGQTGSSLITITVTDPEGKADTTFFTVNILPKPVQPVATVTVQPTCSVSTGTIVVSSPIGVGFTYSIDGINYQSATTFSNVKSGTYDVTIKNSAGCISTSTTVTVNIQPVIPNTPVSNITKQPSCALATATLEISSPLANGHTYSIDSVNYQSGTVFTGLASGTYFVRAKNSEGCVSAPAKVTVNVQPPTPATPSVSAGGNTTICSGDSVILTSSTAIGNQWYKDGVIIGDAIGFAYKVRISGSYTVVSTNASGCRSLASAAVVVKVNPLPDIKIDQGSVVPFGNCDNTSLSLKAIATPAADTYQWYKDGDIIPNATSSVYPITSVGNYKVSVTLNGCANTSAVSAVVKGATLLTPAESSICAGDTMKISVDTSSSPTVTFQWQRNGVDISGATSSRYDATLAGTYKVVVTALGISVPSCETKLTVKSRPVINVVSNLANSQACVGTNINLQSNVTSGNAPYTYQWLTDGNVINAATDTKFTVTTSGNYSVKVFDGNGCFNTSAVNQIVFSEQPALPVANVTVQPTCTVSAGTILVSSPVGIGYQYSIDGVNYQLDTKFTNVPGGLYQVTVKNSVGCISNGAPISVNLQPAIPPTPLVAVLAQPSCNISTGTFNVNSPTGSNYTFSINGINYQTSPTFTQMPAGSYAVRVKNEVGCVSAVANVTINTQPATPNAPIVNVTLQPSCIIATGTIVVSNPVGSGLTYQLDTLAFRSDATFTNIPAGYHTVYVKNSLGCISQPTSVRINDQPPTPQKPIITADSATNICAGTTVRLNSSSRYGNQWFRNGMVINGANQDYYDVQLSGNYNVQVTNEFGCISEWSDTTIVTVSELPEALITKVSNLAFSNCGSTSLILGATYTSGTNYQWFKDGVKIDTAIYVTFQVKESGSYQVEVTSGNGCSNLSPITKINDPSTIGTPGSNNMCLGDSVSLKVEADTLARLSYQWQKNGVNIPGADSSFYIAKDSGIYKVLVFDSASGLTATSCETKINLNGALPVLNVTIDPANGKNCIGAVVQLEATATSAAGIFSYQWLIDSLPIGNAITNKYEAFIQGNYMVTVTDSNGCVTSSSAKKVEFSSKATTPVVNITEQPGCLKPTGIIEVTSPIGNDITYSIDGVKYQVSPIFNDIVPGNYSVTAKNSMKCASDAVLVTINTQPPTPVTPVASVIVQPSCLDSTATISVNSPAGNEYSYSIDGSNYQSAMSFSDVKAGIYTVRVKNNLGCESNGVTVIVNERPKTIAAPVATVTAQPTCENLTGTITVTPSGNSGEVYSIDSINFKADNIFKGLAPGTYRVYTQGAAGCISAATTLVINPPPAAPNLPTAIVGEKLIPGFSNKVYSTNAVPGASSYVWTLPNGWVGSSSSNSISTVAGIIGGKISVAAVVNGCVSAAAILNVQVIKYNPDFNVTYVYQPVYGNVHTNDTAFAGTTYGTPVPSQQNPDKATITLKANGSYEFFSSNPGVFHYVVPACFVGQISDCPLIPLTITVLEPNSILNPPVANTDIATTKKDSSTIIHILSNDKCGNVGCALDTASISILNNPGNGTLMVLPDGTVKYTPNKGFSGLDLFTYSICDDAIPKKCDSAEVFILVLPDSALPITIAGDDYTTTGIQTPVQGSVISNDYNTSGASIAVVVYDTIPKSTGTISIQSDGNYTFVPAPGFSGPVDIPYTVCGGNPESCAKATLHILVSPQGMNAVTKPDVNNTYVNVPVIGNVATNDDVVYGSTYGTPEPVTTNPKGANIVMNPNGSYTFTAIAPGIYIYMVKVCAPGQSANCPPVPLTITVLDLNSNNPPVANTDIAATKLNVAVTIKTLANDKSNNDNSRLVPASVLVTAPPKNGTAKVDGLTGNVTYSPNTDFAGNDTLYYTVCDNSPTIQCAIAMQVITVLDANALNTTFASDDYNSTIGTKPIIDNLLNNDIDPEKNIQTVTPQDTLLPQGRFVLNNDGAYIFTPKTNISGPLSITYSVCDDGSPTACAKATLYILIKQLSISVVAKPDVLKTLAQITPVNNSSYIVTFKIKLVNNTSNDYRNVQVQDDLSKVFKNGSKFVVQEILTSDSLYKNQMYDGVGVIDLITLDSKLPAGKTDSILLSVEVNTTNATDSNYLNVAKLTAVSPVGDTVSLESNDPVINPTDSTIRTPTPFLLSADDVFIPDGFSPNNDGIDDTYTIKHNATTTISLYVFNRWGNVVYNSFNYKDDWDGRSATSNILGQYLIPGTYFYMVTANKASGITKKYVGTLTIGR